jgi:hypothetical protein
LGPKRKGLFFTIAAPSQTVNNLGPSLFTGYSPPVSR